MFGEGLAKRGKPVDVWSNRAAMPSKLSPLGSNPDILHRCFGPCTLDAAWCLNKLLFPFVSSRRSKPADWIGLAWLADGFLMTR